MATDIVGGLFGITPEMYQQNVGENILQQGVQMGQLAPDAFGRANVYAGATQIGRGIAGAMGAEDPQLKLISMRNAIFNRADPNDPNSLMAAAKELAPFDPQGANAVANQAREAALKIAQATRYSREGRALSVGQDVLKAETEAAYRAAIREIKGREPTPENAAALQVYEDKLAALTRTKEAAPLDIQKAQEYRKALIKENAPVAQIAEVDRYIKGLEGGRGTTLTNVLPGAKDFVDIPRFRATVQSTIDPEAKTVYAADQALQSINDSLSTNNFASFRAAQVQFARAISGAGDLSQRELTAAGADPSILGGAVDTISKLFDSTPSTDTQEKMKKTLQAIRTVAAKKANDEISRQAKIAGRQPGYTPEIIAEALDFPQFKMPTAAPSAGGPFTDAEKEKRYQAWKNSQTGQKP
jgi:hypothetical protein